MSWHACVCASAQAHVCKCAYERGRRLMCTGAGGIWTHALEDKGLPRRPFLCCLSPFALRKGFSLACPSPRRLGWMSSEPQGPACVHNPVLEIQALGTQSGLSLELGFSHLPSRHSSVRVRSTAQPLGASARFHEVEHFSFLLSLS